MTSPLEQQPSVAAEEKEREPPMERRRLPVYKRFRHRAEHVVLFIHEYYFFFRGERRHRKTVCCFRRPRVRALFLSKRRRGRTSLRSLPYGRRGLCALRRMRGLS